MRAEGRPPDILPTLTASTNSLSSTSILTWIYRLHTPPLSSSVSPSTSTPSEETPPTPTHLEETPTRPRQRSRSVASAPSEFLGDGPRLRKRRKLLSELDVHTITNPTHLSTPRSEGSSLNRTRSPSRSIPSTAMSGSTPQTPSSKRVKYVETPSRLNLRMSLRGLMLNDDAFDEATEFKDLVSGIVSAERGSAMKTGSVKRFRASVKQYEWSNEATFLHHIIPILHGYGYHVKVDPGEEKHLGQGKLEWRDFLVDEGVVYHLDKDFTRTLLPGRFDEDVSLTSELTKHLAKEAGMVNPRPDMLYGLRSDKYSIAVGTEVPPRVLELLEIVSDVRHAFLIIEGKSHAGSSAVAENQARRGGATLVKASRKLRAILQEGGTSSSNDDAADLEELETPGSPGTSVAQLKQKRAIKPDFDTFVFSVTISPLHFTVWVHWYDEGNQLYHMNLVDSFAIRGAKGPNQIRWAMHNIVQWGANDRASQHTQLIRDVEAYSKVYTERRAGEDQAKGTAKSGKSAEQSRSSSSPLKRASDESS